MEGRQRVLRGEETLDFDDDFEGFLDNGGKDRGKIKNGTVEIVCDE